MFAWNEFRSLALVAAESLAKNDSELSKLLGASSPASEKTDELGRPVPESVGIHQMTDPEHFKRALRIRRDLARNEGNRSYVTYADSVLSFLEPITADVTIFTVLVATKKGNYEILFVPQLKKTLAQRVIS